MRFTRKNGLTTLALLCASIGVVQALPVNPVFRLGAGNYSASGSSATLNLTTFNAKNTALIDWDSFNIGKPDLLTFKDKTGNSTSKNVVNQTSTASTIAGSVTADPTLKLIVVSPNGVSVTGTAAISAGGFAAFSGNTTVQPSGQVLIMGTPGAVSLATGAAVNRSGSNSLSVAPNGEIAFEIPTGTARADGCRKRVKPRRQMVFPISRTAQAAGLQRLVLLYPAAVKLISGTAAVMHLFGHLSRVKPLRSQA